MSSSTNSCYYDDEGIDVQFNVSNNDFEFDDTAIGDMFVDNEARMDEIIETFNLLDKVDDIDRFLETFESDELTSNQHQINYYGDNSSGNVYNTSTVNCKLNNCIGSNLKTARGNLNNNDNLATNYDKITAVGYNEDYTDNNNSNSTNDLDDDEVLSDGATIDENSICSDDWIDTPSTTNIVTDVDMCLNEDSSESGMDVCSSNWDDFESEHELSPATVSVTCKQRAYEMTQHLSNKVQCQQQQQQHVNALFESNSNSNHSDIINKHHQFSINKTINTSTSRNNNNNTAATVTSSSAKTTKTAIITNPNTGIVTAAAANNNKCSSNTTNPHYYTIDVDDSDNDGDDNDDDDDDGKGNATATSNNETDNDNSIKSTNISNRENGTNCNATRQIKVNDAKITDKSLPSPITTTIQHFTVPILTFTLPCLMEPKLWGPTQTLAIKRFRYQNPANDKYITTIYNEPNAATGTNSMWKVSKSTQIPERQTQRRQKRQRSQHYKLTDIVLWQKEIFVLDRKCFNDECVIEATLLLWHKHLNGLIDPQALELIERDHVESILYIVDVERLDNIDVRNRPRLWRRRLLENLFLPTSSVQLIPQTLCMSFDDLNQQCYRMQQIYPITGIVLKNDANLNDTSTSAAATVNAYETTPVAVAAAKNPITTTNTTSHNNSTANHRII